MFIDEHSAPTELGLSRAAESYKHLAPTGLVTLTSNSRYLNPTLLTISSYSYFFGGSSRWGEMLSFASFELSFAFFALREELKRKGRKGNPWEDALEILSSRINRQPDALVDAVGSSRDRRIAHHRDIRHRHFKRGSRTSLCDCDAGDRCPVQCRTRDRRVIR